LTSIALLWVPVTDGHAQGKGRHGSSRPEAAIRAVLEAQAEAWNRGDIDGFMEGYLRSDSTRFASGGSIVRGWQTVRDRYRQRYNSAEKMGRLTFSDLEITVLSPRSALVFGRWRVERAADAPSGLFTLHFVHTKAGWRIAADHTSSAEPPAPNPSRPAGEIG
jgi:ketosteroid isomerase-like protein